MDSRDPPRRSIAVALRHSPDDASLPRVVASGTGALADRILDLAFANGVRVREDADLAVLLSAADLDAEIPLSAVEAVAEVLAHLYRANAGGGDAAATASVHEELP